MQKLEIKNGQRFGRLSIIEELPIIISNNGQHKRIFSLICDCGNKKTVLLKDLTSGHIQSCGCLYKESRRWANKTHGLSDSRLYRKWNYMKARCYNPNVIGYADYGGRGIKIYEPWLNDPVSFIDYCKTIEGWDNEELSIDRINTNGNYEPRNIRFATDVQQGRNKRINKHNKTGYAGITKEIMPSGNVRYRASVGGGKTGIKIQIGSFRSVQDARNARYKYITENNLEGYCISEKTFIELVKENNT